MGNSSYSVSSRTVRADSLGYTTNSVDNIFTQNKKREIHEGMNPNGVIFRESCDSVEHPLTVPIQLYLDVTGSMGQIPHEMIKSGLPTLMGTLIQNGVKDAALMFGAIGDHETDYYPLQIGQFESGDAELDMWLTRTYLEGNGGGNAGESYLLAWYFSANHVKTDAFNKRNKKGFVFTIGDEPCLRNLPLSSIKEIMGNSAIGQSNYTMEELLSMSQEKNHVYHIHVNHNGRTCDSRWKELLGANLIEISDHRTVSKVIADIILSKNIDDTPQSLYDNIEKNELNDIKIVDML
jgi:hypothetical protein